MAQISEKAIDEPFDLIKGSLDQRVLLKCRLGRELEGKLHAYNNHLNMVLGDVTERVLTTREGLPPMTPKEALSPDVKTQTRSIEMVFVRGDTVIHISQI